MFSPPLIFSNALSKYCFSVIFFPFLSTNLRLKSLNSHKKYGKYCANSSLLSSLKEFFNFIVLLKFRTKLKELMAFSSIVPKELKINKELINIAIKNIFESWLTSSSYAPSPSVSIIKQGNSSLLFFIIMGSDHIHIPLVQGLKVGPTENPDFALLFKITLFNKNDLPVLYFPTKLIIPICFIFF